MTIDGRIKELIEEIRICVHKIRMLKATKKGSIKKSGYGKYLSNT
jgi:hypothetical protein